MMRLSHNWLGMFQVLAAASIWGAMGTFAKFLFNNEISPYDLAQLRSTLTFVILFSFLLLTKKELLKIKLKDLPYLFTFGIGALAIVEFTYLLTISLTNVATAIFLQYTAPAIILLYGLMVKTEKLNLMKILALLAAVLGGYLIFLGNAGSGLKLVGIISGLLSAVAFAFNSIYGKHGLEKFEVWTLLTWGFGFAALAWVFYQPPWVLIFRYNGEAWLQFLYMAVLMTILPFGLFFKGLKHLSAFSAGLISTVEPVVGALTAYIFLDENLNTFQSLGSLSILIGVVLVQFASSEGESASG